MIKYQYQIIKYVHDQFTGEFVNVGLVIYSPDSHFLKAKVVNRYSRINSLFPDANGRFILRLLRNFESEIFSISKQLSELFKPSADLKSITSDILPNDNSALQLSDVKLALDINLDAALNDLYKDIVEKYIVLQHNSNTLSDDDVWKKRYKEYFDKYNVSERLTKHEVSTTNDIFSFEKAWKNEIWHCYQPISFELQNQESIKDKVYKWVGRIQEINKAKEKIHLTFLSSISENHKSLKTFIFNHLDYHTEQLQIHVVLDVDAEKTAKHIKEMMVNHDQH